MPAKVRGVLNFFIYWLRGKQMNRRASRILAATLPLLAAFFLATATFQPRESFAVNTNTISSYNSTYTYYYFPWYDSVWGKTWALMASYGLATESSDYNLYLRTDAGNNNFTVEQLNTDALYTSPGDPTMSRIYMGKIGGPLQVESSYPAAVSERSLFGNSFEEVWAVPYDELDSHYWWPVYDSATPGMKNWILAANPWENQENIIAKIRIHRQPSEGGDIIESHNLAPGETWTPIYQGVFGSPVEMTAWSASGIESNPTDARKVVASQRVLWNGAFNEMMGIPASSLSSEYFWTWYDDDSPGADNWIVVGNPNPQDVYVTAVVGSPLSPIFVDVGMVRAGEVGITRKPGMGGPVYIISCYDINDCLNTSADVFASQRVLFGPSFGELTGTGITDIIPVYDWTWYDQQSPGSINWVLVSNLTDQKLYSEIKVNGVLRWAGGIEGFSNATPTLNGVMGGPVNVQAWLWELNEYGQQKRETYMPILASQRVLWNGYFNEIVGK